MNGEVVEAVEVLHGRVGPSPPGLPFDFPRTPFNSLGVRGEFGPPLFSRGRLSGYAPDSSPYRALKCFSNHPTSACEASVRCSSVRNP